MREYHDKQLTDLATSGEAYQESDQLTAVQGRKFSRIKSLLVATMGMGLSGYVLFALQTFLWQAGALSIPLVERELSFHQRLSFLLVYYSIYMSVAIVALSVKNLVLKNLGRFSDLMLLLGLMTSGGLLALFYSFQPTLLLVNLVINAELLVLAKKLLKNYSYAGINFYLANWLTIGVGLSWGAWFLFSMHVSLVTRLLLMSSAPLLLITLPSDFLQMFELYDVVCRENWKRPRAPYPKRIYGHEPMVSIHVPTYSEPPEMVMETLNNLARLEYSNYEVIVIDNNTKDPVLWMPVKEHCLKLGPRFRFIHVDDMPGAKGGALNYALTKTNRVASIIGVIDADYHADPQFLQALVGHFDNSSVGFVQTPHDYRDWRGNLFLTLCYWEYKIFFHSAMISLNERGAGITVGTMCLVRKEALKRAGGWSEWCVTEDSELAIRIHDVGYSSVYVDKTYGRGLIPDTFEGYKKQRYRWTAGPVQEFRYHFRHFAGLSKRPSRFTLTQRLYHMNHGLDNVLLGFNIPLMLVGLGLVASMILHHEVVAVPFEMWVAATVMFLTDPLLSLLMYRATIRPNLFEMIGKSIAAKGLSHTIYHSALRTCLTGNAEWNRTSKFKSKHSYAAALLATKEEMVIGFSLTALVITAYLIFPFTGLSLMLLIGLSYVALRYLMAPLMGLIGVWSLGRASRTETSDTYLVPASASELPLPLS